MSDRKLIAYNNHLALNTNFNVLKSAIDCPRLHLANLIENLKKQIDNDFETKQKEQKNIKIWELINSDWASFIREIQSFETNCYQKLTLNPFKYENAYKINQIEFKFEQLNQLETDDTESVETESNELHLINEINDLINDEIFKIEKIIFMDQFITFLKEKECECKIWFQKIDGKMLLDNQTNAGKLLIISNGVISNKCLELFKKYFEFFFLIFT